MGSIEGLIENRYWRIFDTDDWDRISSEYHIGQYAPSFKIIGAVDLDALCIRDDGHIFLIPFIPMQATLAEKCTDSLENLRQKCEFNMQPIDKNHEAFGKQLHLIKPLAFGGDRNDSNNITFVSQSKHAELCCFWNKTYHDIQSKS